MAVYQNAELIELFTAYTAGPDSIGAHLRDTAAAARADDPLLAVTGADMALYPGGGRPPTVLGLRLTTRGFKELAAVSHLGPALTSLVALKNLDEHGVWRADAESLLAAIRSARAANSTELWRDKIAVEAYRGREPAIATMVDYACGITERYLERALADPRLLDHRLLRERYFEDGDRDELPVSFNRIMIATFYLIGLDSAHRLITWCDEQRIDWSRTMVVVAGRQGRPTAGVTWRTNSIAALVLAASRGRLPLQHLYVAPHAPVFDTPIDGDLREIVALEPELRALWAGTRATVQLGAHMFEGYPAFNPAFNPAVGEGEVGEMPPVRNADDWFALVTRLRMVMEDPRQLLSGAVTDFAARELVAHGNIPAKVTVPGLDGERFPGVRRR
jgi:hypothetical protein